MNLVRLGHYFTPNQGDPSSGSCQTALVTGHDTYGGAEPETVHLHVWSHEGEDLGARRNVPSINLAGLYTHDGGGAVSSAAPSFHLSGDCPFRR